MRLLDSNYLDLNMEGDIQGKLASVLDFLSFSGGSDVVDPRFFHPRTGNEIRSRDRSRVFMRAGEVWGTWPKSQRIAADQIAVLFHNSMRIKGRLEKALPGDDELVRAMLSHAVVFDNKSKTLIPYLRSREGFIDGLVREEDVVSSSSKPVISSPDAIHTSSIAKEGRARAPFPALNMPIIG